MQRAQERQAEYANRTRKEITFRSGDQVLLSREHFSRRSADGSRKLEPLFTEPLTIKEMVSPVAARLELPPHMRRMHDVFHVSMLEPYRNAEAQFPGRPIPTTQAPPRPDDPTADYIVEAFLDVQKVGTRLQYLVKWRDYPDSENSWEPSWALARDLGRPTYLEFARVLRERMATAAAATDAAE
jgi:hypothetical protein